MSWTKREFVQAAFEEIGLASYFFDLQPEQLQGALRRLDSIMAKWSSIGIRISYPLPSSPSDSDLDDETGVPDFANEAIYTALAISIAPGYGKVVPIETKTAARNGYQAMINQSVKPIEYQLPETMPRGAGQKPWRTYNDEFLPVPEDTLKAGDDSELEFD